MKILVVGLDCAAPEVLFADDSLANIRRVMDAGCYGKLESVVPLSLIHISEPTRLDARSRMPSSA